jgi:hypothetical protein
MTHLRSERMELEDVFYCRARKRTVPLGKCLADYLTANAFDYRRRLCHRCPQGRTSREIYAQGGPAPMPTPTCGRAHPPVRPAVVVL